MHNLTIPPIGIENVVLTLWRYFGSNLYFELIELSVHDDYSTVIILFMIFRL